MITANDIGKVFQSMRIAYGPQWKHGAEAVPVWRDALKDLSVDDLRRAVNRVLEIHTAHPPTLPQFIQVAKPAPVRSTYIEAPKRSNAETIGNLVLLRNLRKHLGVDRTQLKMLVDLKNALVDECEDERPSRDWIEDIDRQLDAMAGNHDPALKAQETALARETLSRRLGIGA